MGIVIWQEKSMTTGAPIEFRDFWDYPRIFLARVGEETFLFDCRFDKVTEDFPDHYQIFLMPIMPDDELTGSWDRLSDRAIRFLGELAVSAVRFDPTRRESVDVSVLDA